MNIPVKYRVTFGLVGLLITIISFAGAMGLAPNERAAMIHGRGDLSSSLAIQTSVLLNRRDYKSIERTLEGVVQRNDQMLSAALRTNKGKLEAIAGDHEALWDTNEDNRSLETHVAVPLNVGKKKWGHLEVLFQPVYADRATAAWISPSFLYLTFVSLLSLVAFAYYLGTKV